VFFALLLPQAFAIWSWATSLSLLALPTAPTKDAQDLGSKAVSRPLATAVWLGAIFSLAGLPLLGSFPGRLALLDGVAAASPWAAAGALIGSLGLLAGGVRNLIATLAASHGEKHQWAEEVEPAPVRTELSDVTNPYVWAFAALATLATLGFGLLPQVFLSAVPGLAAMFSQLSP
ncbi:MAG TPA: proton-conducting transporter membrane subunit, partial [Anaerolineales bacterium]